MKVDGYKVEGVNALTPDKLPTEYMNGLPRAYVDPQTDDLVVVVAESDYEKYIRIKRDTIYSLHELNTVMAHLGAAKDRLHQIIHRDQSKHTVFEV